MHSLVDTFGETNNAERFDGTKAVTDQLVDMQREINDRYTPYEDIDVLTAADELVEEVTAALAGDLRGQRSQEYIEEINDAVPDLVAIIDNENVGVTLAIHERLTDLRGRLTEIPVVRPANRERDGVSRMHEFNFVTNTWEALGRDE